MLNLKSIHYVALVASAIAAGIPGLEAAFPSGAGAYLKAGQAVLILVAAVLGAVSPSAAASPTVTS